MMIMELNHIFLLFLFLIPFVFLFLQKLIQRTNSQIPEKKILPPGRTGWPLVGETLDYFSKFRQGALHEFVTDRMKKYSSNIFRTSLLGESMAVFCDAEGNKFLFSNANKFVKHWWPSIIDKLFPKSNKSNDEHGKSMHKLLTLFIKGDGLRERVGSMDEVMKRHLHTYSNCTELNVSEMAKRYIMALACNTFLGINDPVKIAKVAKATDVTATGIQSIPLNFPGTALNRAIRTSEQLREEFEEMIRQRRIDHHLRHISSSSEKDFVSQMLLATDDDGQIFFTEADIASNLFGILLGAYSNVHTTITNIMMYLSELPEVYNSVLEEQREVAKGKQPEDRLNWDDLKKMNYTWNVACEVLRIKTPGTGGFKEAITDFNYGDYTIPKGWKIHWIFEATHKNPKYFPDPEKFDPSRFQGIGPSSYSFLPFGGGSRMCPGNEYARAAILIFLHNMVTKYRWEKKIADEKFLYYPAPMPSQGLPIQLYPHKP